jgi:type I restriction enzyme S subunit
MDNWKEMELGKAIQFNPSERIAIGQKAKKIPMDRLIAFEKKIRGYEIAEYNAGPKFRNGDTLVAKITPCLENGKTAQVDILDENEVAFGSSEFIVLRQNEYTTNDFIFYLAKSPAFRKRAIGCMEGTSGRKRVNEGALKLQVLPIPDPTTQQKIASVLSALDAKIELNRRINAELEAMAKTLYDYWFVQFDFPDAQGRPYKSSGGKMVWCKELGREVPEGWEAVTLNNLGDITGGSTPSKDIDAYFTSSGIPWITPKDLSLNVGNKFISNGEMDITEAGMSSASLNILPRGSVLMSSRAPVGYLAIARNDVTTNQGFKSFIPKSYYSTEYIYYTIKNLMPVIENNASGSTFKEVSGSVLKTIYGLSPKKETVQSYTNLISSIFARQELLETENSHLSSLRDWLLPMLMNGQVRVG